MAAPQAGLTLTAQEQFLAEKTEEAIHDGGQLERWCRERDRDLVVFPLNLKKTYGLPNRAEGFFGSLEINGEPRSVMGCRQNVSWGRTEARNSADLLRDFVLGSFLGCAHWQCPDGAPGGFGIEQSLYKAADGSLGRFAPELRKGCIDWRQLGARYTWVLLTVQIHDFVMDFGPFRKRFREAACVSPHASFMHVVEKPFADCELEISIGYPFVEFAPIPNVFGFGPGKFGVAVKLYSFFLMGDGEIRVRMYFAAAPRARKVFDFGTHWPDPVYGGARLLRSLSLGRWDVSAFHDKIDGGMLTQHCRVHQALMEGTARIWREKWAGKSDPKGA